MLGYDPGGHTLVFLRWALGLNGKFMIVSVYLSTFDNLNILVILILKIVLLIYFEIVFFITEDSSSVKFL